MTSRRPLQIKYDTEESVFYSGDLLSGNIVINATEVTSVKYIAVRLHGEGFAEWRQTGQFIQMIPSCKKSAVYLEKTHYLAQGDVLQPGTHTIPFQHQLSEALPSSFQGFWGYVRYKCTATLVRKEALKMSDRTSEYFSVIRNLDLNLRDPMLREYVEHRKSKIVHSLCCRGAAGDIQATFRINKRGFVPGEDVKIHVDVQNNCTSSVKVKVSFRQLCKYDVSDMNTDSISTYRKIYNKKSETIIPDQHFQWDDVRIKIPASPPTGLEGCDFIHVKHIIMFKVTMKGSPGITVEQDLVIGTVPLRETGNMINEMLPSYEEARELPPNGPPSYDDSQLEENPEGSSYYPMYPVYDFPPEGPAPDPPETLPPAYEERDSSGACGSDWTEVTHF